MNKLSEVVTEARRRYENGGQVQRIFKAYGLYCIRPADADFDGEHVAYVTYAAYEDCCLTKEVLA